MFAVPARRSQFRFVKGAPGNDDPAAGDAEDGVAHEEEIPEAPGGLPSGNLT